MSDDADPTARSPRSGDGEVLYSSGANQRRYRGFASHLLPRSRRGKLLVAVFVAVLLLAEWPLLALANRVEPLWFGIPFLFSYLLLVYVALIGVLIVSAYLEL